MGIYLLETTKEGDLAVLAKHKIMNNYEVPLLYSHEKETQS